MEMENEETNKEVIAKESDNLSPAVLGEGVFDSKDLMEGVNVQLPKIEIIHAAGMFSLPDGKMVESFEGTIIDIYRANAYWPVFYDDGSGNDSPTCFSRDGVMPSPESEHIENNTCAGCPKSYNKIAKKDGKPTEPYCKNMKVLHVIVPGSLLPHKLVLSVMNLRPVDTYISLLTGAATPYPLINTEFSLRTAASKSGKGYSEIVLKNRGLTPLVKKREDVQKVKNLIMQWKKVMRNELDFEDGNPEADIDSEYI